MAADASTVLVAVTDNPSDAAALEATFSPQLPGGAVLRCSGYYPTISAVDSSVPVVVADVGEAAARDEWRLAELRARTGDATVVVVAAAAHLATLAGALQADLAVTRVRDLPPLRELLTTALETPQSVALHRDEATASD